MPDYFTRIKTLADKRNAVQREADKRAMNLNPLLNEIEERLGANEQFADDIFNNPGSAGPVNDGIPPSAPQNLVAEPVPVKAIDLIWDAPIDGEYVDRAVIEVTPAGGSAFEVPASPHFGGANNLAHVIHSFRAKFIDMFDLESAWSTPVTALPPLTVAEEIELDTLAAGGRLAGLLPNANLATITDPAKLAEEAVKTIANVGNKNMLPYIESRPDHFNEGAWADVGPGKQGYGGTATVNVVTSAGRKWWQLVPGTNNWAQLFQKADYNQIIGSTYIVSCRVRNPTGTAITNAGIGFEAYTASGGNVSSVIGTRPTVPANGEIVIMSKVTIPALTTNLWFWIDANGGSPLFSDFMLEKVDPAATVPTAYSVPALIAGAIGANSIAALDLATINAVIGNASISSAKIEQLVADKITTGTITAATITLTNTGSIQAGPQVKLNSTGLSLAPTASEDDSSLNAAYKISDSLLGKSVIHFYNDNALSTNYHRGIALRSEGTTNTRGIINLHAMMGTGVLQTSSMNAGIEIRSGKTASPTAIAEVVASPYFNVEKHNGVGGNVEIEGSLTVYGDTNTPGGFAIHNSFSGTVAANTGLTWSHNYNEYPNLMFVWQVMTNGQRKPLPVGSTNSVHIAWYTTTQHRVQNSEGSAWTVEGHLWHS